MPGARPEGIVSCDSPHNGYLLDSTRRWLARHLDGGRSCSLIVGGAGRGARCLLRLCAKVSNALCFPISRRVCPLCPCSGCRPSSSSSTARTVPTPGPRLPSPRWTCPNRCASACCAGCWPPASSTFSATPRPTIPQQRRPAPLERRPAHRPVFRSYPGAPIGHLAHLAGRGRTPSGAARPASPGQRLWRRPALEGRAGSPDRPGNAPGPRRHAARRPGPPMRQRPRAQHSGACPGRAGRPVNHSRAAHSRAEAPKTNGNNVSQNRFRK